MTGTTTHSDEPAVPTGEGGLVRLRVDLAYDGSAYHGWARQAGQASVQETLEAALATVLRQPVALTVAGRTDAGVHATGQVAHVDVHDVDTNGLEAVARRVNGVLSDDIRVHRVSVAAAGFDARFGALWRRYAYRVADGPVNPLRRHDTLAWPRELDVDLLRAASEPLVGEHDFAAYCRRREGATTIRTLQCLDWHRGGDGVLTATVQADAFCHSMVRSLVGALLAVGDGRRAREWPAGLLERGTRVSDVAVAPAHGLTLVEVAYPPEGELAARAEQTRARRDPR